MEIEQPAVEPAVEAETSQQASLAVETKQWGARNARRLAWTMWTLSVVLVAIGLIIPYVTDISAFKADLLINALGMPTVLAYATVGALIASRRPKNPIGWIYCAAALLIALQTFAQAYTRYALETRPGTLPGGQAMAWLVRWPITLGILLILTFPLLLFPNGRLPSRRWLPIAWLTAGSVAVLVLLDALKVGVVLESLAIDNPLGIVELIPVYNLLFNPLLVVTLIVCLASVIIRFRSAKGDERQQIKWFVYASVLVIVLLFGVPEVLAFFNASKSLQDAISDPVLVLAVSSFAVATGIAILKYRLYDIDLLINRTLVYIPLTGILAGLYSASIALFQRVFVGVTGEKSDAAIVLTTLVLASSFTPIKNGLQVVVDRRFKEAHDPTKKLRAFGEQVRSFVQLSSTKQITERLLDEAISAFDASGGVVFLGQDGDLQLVHASDEWKGYAQISVPLKGRGEEFGLISLGPRRNGAEYTPSDYQSLREIVDVVAQAIEVAGRGR